MRRALTLVSLFAALAAALATAQPPSTEPAWLLYERGKSLMEDREYGKALQALKDAIAQAGILPEADLAIGEIYREEGETALALRQYEKAYNLRSALSIPETKYDILYRIASLYEDQELYALMQQRLEMIIADDPSWSGGQGSLLRIQVDRNYADKGLDHVLRLYRFPASFAIAAHQQLGWLAYRTGFPSEAIPHFLYAIITQVSELDTYLKRRDPDFSFTDLKAFLSTALEDSQAAAYLEESGIFSDLYYLASSTHASAKPKQAAAIWSALAGIPQAGRFVDLSRRQLKKPFYEPLLDPSFKYRKP